MQSQISTIGFSYYPQNRQAILWEKKIKTWLKKNKPGIKISADRPDTVIALGGDGTILEAARKYGRTGSLIIGLNLGKVGFLASVRKPANFIKRLEDLFKGKYKAVERMMVRVVIKRGGKSTFAADALNEIAIQSLLSMADLEVKIEDHPLQFVRGTGVLISTPTGSTAHNLSAHGPIVTPDIQCLIITEIADHNTPTPSVVVRKNRVITINVLNFRERGILSLSKDGQKIDTVLMVDGDTIFPLRKKDSVIITKSPKLVRFAEFENHYFFKSLQEKFAFE